MMQQYIPCIHGRHRDVIHMNSASLAMKIQIKSDAMNIMSLLECVVYIYICVWKNRQKKKERMCKLYELYDEL